MSATPGVDGNRILIFVDFWNFTLSLRDEEPGFLSNWQALPVTIVAAAQALDASVPPRHHVYQGMRVHGSCDSSDHKLRRWADNFLGQRVAGCIANFVPRQRKMSVPACPACHHAVRTCPSCGNDMRGTEEKGVDTGIATEMISLAWENAYDTAVLVSADRDFVPVVRFLQSKGKNVIHAAFPPKGSDLNRACWGQIDMRRQMQRIRRQPELQAGAGSGA